MPDASDGARVDQGLVAGARRAVFGFVLVTILRKSGSRRVARGVCWGFPAGWFGCCTRIRRSDARLEVARRRASGRCSVSATGYGGLGARAGRGGEEPAWGPRTYRCPVVDKAAIKRAYHVGMAGLSDIDPEWDALYARARLVLDDDGVSAEERRKATAKRKLARAGLDAPPVDIALVKRTLVEYARTKRYQLALDMTGIGKDDMNLAYDLWPESKTVYEYVQRMRNEERTREMDEVADLATDKLKVLLRDDKGKCMVNAKLVMETLERLDRKRFGDDGGAGSGPKKDGGGSPMVYQISNVQLNLYGTEAVKNAFPSGGVVDVDSVVRALEGGSDG